MVLASGEGRYTKKPTFDQTNFAGRMNQTGNLGGSRPGINFGRPIRGEITSLDDKTMTISTDENGSKIIIYSDSTVVNKTNVGTISDLKVGDTITIMGKESSEGTIDANTINVGMNEVFGQQPQELKTDSSR